MHMGNIVRPEGEIKREEERRESERVNYTIVSALDLQVKHGE